MAEADWKNEGGGWRSRTLDWDPELQRRTVYWFHDDTMQQRLVEHWDVSPIIEANKADYAMTDERASWRGGGEHELGTLVGRIPISIAEDVLKKTGWGQDRKAVSKWLTDKDNQYFLTRPVRFGV